MGHPRRELTRIEVTAITRSALRRDNLDPLDARVLTARHRLPQSGPTAQAAACGMPVEEYVTALEVALDREHRRLVREHRRRTPPKPTTEARLDALAVAREASNTARASAVGSRNAAAARAIIEHRGDDIDALYRDVLIARADDPAASLSVLASRCGMTKDAYAARLRRALTTLAVPRSA